MASFPSATRIERATPSGEQSVSSVTPVDSGFSALGRDIGYAGDQLQKREMRDRRYKLTSASLAASTEIEKTGRSFDQDPDYETIPDRFDEEVDKRIQEQAAGISNAEDRNEFIARANLQAERARSQMLGKVWTKEKDDHRSRINQNLDDARESALTGDMGEIGAQVRENLESGQEMGYISAQERQDLFSNWAQNAALGKLEMMPPEAWGKALNQPWADNIPGDVRAKYRRKGEENTLVLQSIGVVDGIMEGTESLKTSEILKKGNGIIDALPGPLRLKAEPRFRQTMRDHVAVDTARKMEISGALTTEILDNGGTVDGLSPENTSLYEELEPAQKVNLRNMEAGPRTVSDFEARKFMLRLLADKEWGQADNLLTFSRSLFSTKDIEKFGEAMAKGQAPSDINIAKMVKASISSSKYTDIRPGVEERVGRWFDQFKDINKEDPSDDELQAEIDRQVMDVANGFITYNYMYHMDDEDRAKALKAAQMSDLREDSLSNFNDTRAYILSQGDDPKKTNRFEFALLYKTQQLVANERLRTHPENIEAVDRTDKQLEVDGIEAPTHQQWFSVYDDKLRELRAPEDAKEDISWDELDGT